MATFRGLPCCTCQEDWLPKFDAVLRAEGIVVRWTQLIGGYIKSGGTHATGGASDAIISKTGKRTMAAAHELLIRLARQAGADASWHRRRGWDGADGVEHDHLVLNDCPHRSPSAERQTEAVEAGHNGLANNGPDDGPRPLSGRSWREGIVWMNRRLKPAPVKYRIVLDGRDLRTLVYAEPNLTGKLARHADGRAITLRHGDVISVETVGRFWLKTPRGNFVRKSRARKAK